MYPQPNSEAPAFSLPSSQGKTISLKDLTRNGPAVVYFYPKADTPGCTRQACGLRDIISEIQAKGASIVGISPDPVKPVTDFAEKFSLNFPLLADENHAVCEAYGVWQEKSMYGKTFMGAARTTFIISKDGKITHVFEKVKPETHDQTVLQALG